MKKTYVSTNPGIHLTFVELNDYPVQFLHGVFITEDPKVQAAIEKYPVFLDGDIAELPFEMLKKAQDEDDNIVPENPKVIKAKRVLKEQKKVRFQKGSLTTQNVE